MTPSEQTHEIITGLQENWRKLMQLRSAFPYGRKRHVGQTVIESPGYYSSRGFQVKIEFANPLTENDVQLLTDLGYWVNQNFIIRCCAILEAGGVLTKDKNRPINFTLPGAEDLNILRKLRNRFAHTAAFNPKSDGDRDLYGMVMNRYKFSVTVQQPTDRIPLPIDQVLEPMLGAVMKYVQAFETGGYGSPL